jgi:hypothetical protein
MALVVEDGTGLPTANSYVTIAECDAYHVDRANTSWGTALTAAKTAALMKATMYIDGKYFNRFTGYKGSVSQALQWPRMEAIESGVYILPDGVSDSLLSGIPVALKQATYEAALLALTTDLTSVLDRGGMLRFQKVGPISQEFMDGAPAESIYRAVEYWLKPILKSAYGVSIERA